MTWRRKEVGAKEKVGGGRWEEKEERRVGREQKRRKGREWTLVHFNTDILFKTVLVFIFLTQKKERKDQRGQAFQTP